MRIVKINAGVRAVGLFISASLLTLGVASAATTSADSWSVISSLGQADVADNSGELTISFAGGAPDPASFIVGAGTDDPNTSFGGDYVAAGIESLDVTVTCEGALPPLSDGIYIEIYSSANNQRFRRYGLIPSTTGVATVYNILMDRTAGGWVNRSGNDNDETWNLTIQNVDTLSVVVERRLSTDTTARSVVVSSVALQGDHVVSPSGTTPLIYALRSVFNRENIYATDDITSEEKLIDTDVDSVTDFIETVAEFDSEAYAKTLFSAEIVSIDSTGVTVKWLGVDSQEYSVWRSSTMNGPFVKVTGTDLTSTGTENMTWKDTSATGTGSYFYRVMKK